MISPGDSPGPCDAIALQWIYEEPKFGTSVKMNIYTLSVRLMVRYIIGVTVVGDRFFLWTDRPQDPHSAKVSGILGGQIFATAWGNNSKAKQYPKG